MEIDRIEYKGYTIVVKYGNNPREHYDNLGTMISLIGKLHIDNHDIRASGFSGWNDIELHLYNHEDAAIVLPLYGYSHGGMDISTHIKPSWPDVQWDVVRVGFIYVSKENVRHEYGWKRISKKRLGLVRSVLEAEVEDFARYLRGDIYAFSVLDEDENGEDWGDGYYDKEAMIAERQSNIDAWLEESD